ncbi:MAG: hypothetical protein RLZ44_1144 [Pseudomonadota bacterium]
MQPGYLSLETSASHPGLVRIRSLPDGPPPLPQGPGLAPDPAVRLVMRYQDLDAARMHAHSALRRRLVDVDAGTYRASLEEAVAGIEAIDLSHRLIYLDPDLDATTRRAIDARIAARRQRQALVDRIWQIVGGLAIGFLVLLMLGF